MFETSLSATEVDNNDDSPRDRHHQSPSTLQSTKRNVLYSAVCTGNPESYADMHPMNQNRAWSLPIKRQPRPIVCSKQCCRSEPDLGFGLLLTCKHTYNSIIRRIYENNIFCFAQGIQGDHISGTFPILLTFLSTLTPLQSDSLRNLYLRIWLDRTRNAFEWEVTIDNFSVKAEWEQIMGEQPDAVLRRISGLRVLALEFHTETEWWTVSHVERQPDAMPLGRILSGLKTLQLSELHVAIWEYFDGSGSYSNEWSRSDMILEKRIRASLMGLTCD